MKRTLVCSAVVGLLVTACGGGASSTSTQSSPPAAGNATASTPAGGPHAKSGSAKAGTVTSQVAPCSLLTRSDVSAAFGAQSSAGREKPNATPPECDYTSGTAKILTVQTSIQTPSQALAVQQTFKTPEPGEKTVSGSGFVGLARTFVVANSGNGTQAGLSLVKGQTLIQLVLTDTGKTTGSLIAPVTRLGRIAARGA
jgi:hypothetical protein